MSTIGERLKTLREEIGLSQKKMAELLNVTPPGINHYEHGKAVPIEVLIGAPNSWLSGSTAPASWMLPSKVIGKC